MVGRTILSTLIFTVTLAAAVALSTPESRAGGRGQPTDWQRFYYYPYVYYSHNFQRPQGSFDHLYYRYPPSMRIPVYNTGWYNAYPGKRPYHKGAHFMLDVF